MPGIVCAIRGGPRSRPTIEKAIALAEEKQQKVYFLYVMNLDFLLQSLHSHISTVTEEALSETETQEDGHFALVPPSDFPIRILAVSADHGLVVDKIYVNPTPVPAP